MFLWGEREAGLPSGGHEGNYSRAGPSPEAESHDLIPKVLRWHLSTLPLIKREYQGAVRHSSFISTVALWFPCKVSFPVGELAHCTVFPSEGFLSPLSLCIIGRKTSFPTDAAARLPVPGGEEKHFLGETVLLKTGTDW